jgi:hypothetical protein
MMLAESSCYVIKAKGCFGSADLFDVLSDTLAL